MTTAVCPGSFDPFTLGHLDVVRRARGLFDHVVVGVAQNVSKNALLDPETRLRIVRAALDDAGLGDVQARFVPGLLVDFCREIGAVAVVKGLRGGGDLDAELPMARMNAHLAGVETVFVASDPALAHVSSSLVKDVGRFGGPVDDLLPAGAGEIVRGALHPSEGAGS